LTMPMLPIYSASAIREVGARAAGARLMERAGEAAAELARGLCGDTAKSVLVVAGPGNNGGDAFEVAALLKRAFFRVTVVFAGERDRLPSDARRALEKWEQAGGALLDSIPEAARFDLAVDGLFGIGPKRPLGGRHRAIVERINALRAPVLALDVPSGIDADTGAVMGCAVRATHTLTFIAHKPGLLTADGPDHCGRLRVAALGVDPAALREPEGALLDADILRAAITPRPRNFHKGQAGSVGVPGRRRGDRRTRRAALRGRTRLPRPAHTATALRRLRAPRADAAQARGGPRPGSRPGARRRARDGQGGFGGEAAARGARGAGAA